MGDGTGPKQRVHRQLAQRKVLEEHSSQAVYLEGK